ncbi:hypothetical protein LSAT2_005896 [Lamellibrachia satsuma]|nr:hypothetical protein LSAT2_005896 [Lamellibrachia satsuma]
MTWERTIFITCLFYSHCCTQGGIERKVLKMCSGRDPCSVTGRDVVITVHPGDAQSSVCLCNVSSSTDQGMFSVTLVSYSFRRRKACEGEIRFTFPRSDKQTQRFCAGAKRSASVDAPIVLFYSKSVVITMTQTEPYDTTLDVVVSGPTSDVVASCVREEKGKVTSRHTRVTTADFSIVRKQKIEMQQKRSGSRGSQMAAAGVGCLVISTLVIVFVFNRRLRPLHDSRVQEPSIVFDHGTTCTRTTPDG